MDSLFVDAGVNAEGTRRRDRITVHTLRHTFASWLSIAGVSFRIIRELLGHKSIQTTERYSHLGSNGLRPYYTELARAVAPGFVPSVAAAVPQPQMPGIASPPNGTAASFVTTLSNQWHF